MQDLRFLNLGQHNVASFARKQDAVSVRQGIRQVAFLRCFQGLQSVLHLLGNRAGV